MRSLDPQYFREFILSGCKDQLTLIQAFQANSHIFGEIVYFELLRDRLLWNQAPKLLQDKATDVVSMHLSQDFLLESKREYACGNQTHRIATFRHLKSNATFNLLPGGTYQMGSESKSWRKRNEIPRHTVSIPPFLIGVFPVTRSNWHKIDNQTTPDDEANLPAVNVSWVMAKEWVERAGSGLRLPSEAEWEYACRAGTDSRYFWGNEMDGAYCWFADNSGRRSHSVKEHESHYNAFGLVDMLGNVTEWCQDGWTKNYKNGPVDHQPKNNQANCSRVKRGGCYYSHASDCRSASRRSLFSGQTYRSENTGFRVARSLNLS